jgi:hypothetical protein
VRIYTAYLRQETPPLLVREGFSWGAAIFGPLWLLLHRAWIPFLLSLAIAIGVAALAHGGVAVVLFVAFAWLLGLCGHDLRRWGLERRGYSLEYVVEARNLDAAYARLFIAVPDLLADIT